MKKLFSLSAVALVLSMGLSAAAQAQTAPAAPSKMAPKSSAAAKETPVKTAQQGKMATCNKDAEGKKGDERKAFMKECLSTQKVAAPQAMTQQGKMKSCNAEATGKKGDERKAFMKECLSK